MRYGVLFLQLHFLGLPEASKVSFGAKKLHFAFGVNFTSRECVNTFALHRIKLKRGELPQNSEVAMKVVLVKPPRYLSKLLLRLVGTKEER